MTLALASQPSTPNERSLTFWQVETFTGLTGTTVTLGQVVDTGNPDGTMGAFVWKNGSLLWPGSTPDYTVAGNVITLTSALIAADKVVVFYHGRSQ